MVVCQFGVVGLAVVPVGVGTGGSCCFCPCCCEIGSLGKGLASDNGGCHCEPEGVR